MRPITEYQDYRKYMRDYYEERKRSSLFSWREFSRLAGFSSPNYLQLVCEGKSRVSKNGIDGVADAMGLEGVDRDYFCAMVHFGDAKNDEKKMQAFLDSQKINYEFQKVLYIQLYQNHFQQMDQQYHYLIQR